MRAIKQLFVADRHGRFGRLAATVMLVFLVGCTSVMPPPMAGGENTQALRAANLAPATVGTFKLADGRPPLMDKELSGGLRGGNVAAPSGSYSQHLRETLKAELQSAGLLDLQSSNVIEGQLTDSKVDAAIGTGTARLAARFQVKRGAQVLFDKELAVDDSWDSSFVGAIAIPRAIERYGAIYRKLVGRLLSDDEFRRHRRDERHSDAHSAVTEARVVGQVERQALTRWRRSCRTGRERSRRAAPHRPRASGGAPRRGASAGRPPAAASGSGRWAPSRG